MNDELQHLKKPWQGRQRNGLHAVGIHSASDLRRLGAVDAYRAVRTRGFRASKVLLYAIEGALMDVHWKRHTRGAQGGLETVSWKRFQCIRRTRAALKPSVYGHYKRAFEKTG